MGFRSFSLRFPISDLEPRKDVEGREVVTARL